MVVGGGGGWWWLWPTGFYCQPQSPFGFFGPPSFLLNFLGGGGGGGCWLDGLVDVVGYMVGP